MRIWRTSAAESPVQCCGTRATVVVLVLVLVLVVMLAGKTFGQM